MGFDLASIFGKGVKEAVTSIGDIADKFITTKQEKEEFKAETEKVLRAAGQAELDSYLQDTQSARDREVKINTDPNSSWLSKNIPGMLALGVTLGFFGMLAWMLNYDVPTTNKDILNIMLGSLGTAWVSIVGFYFGSSMGSKTNAEAIRKIAQKEG